MASDLRGEPRPDAEPGGAPRWDDDSHSTTRAAELAGVPRPALGGGSHHAANRLSLAGLGVAIAFLILTAGCNGNVRAQPIPTVPAQPTPNRTVDAVVRGIVTVALPTTTRTLRLSMEPSPGSARPGEVRQAAPETTARPPTATPRASEPASTPTRGVPGILPQATRAQPSLTRGLSGGPAAAVPSAADGLRNSSGSLSAPGAAPGVPRPTALRTPANP
jgi:hypothetical protein